ncbi:MAG: methanogenesis marker 6 protein [Candidatus Helarchaeota archaeon]
MVVLSPDSRLTPEILAKQVMQLPIIIKVTCWGLILSGDKKVIQNAIKELRLLDPHRIFVKERGYPPGDPRICRFQRGGGPRPGFHYLERESLLLPLISKALELPLTEDTDKSMKPPVKKSLSIKRLKQIIDESEP